MGEVYDTVKDRTVALKLLDVELAKDPTYQQRFRRESHAVARLREPHVIPIHDWGEIDGVLVEQIASALDAAHADGTWYHLSPASLAITTRKGKIVTNERMLESAHR